MYVNFHSKLVCHTNEGQIGSFCASLNHPLLGSFSVVSSVAVFSFFENQEVNDE